MLSVAVDAVRLGQSPGRRGIGTYIRQLLEHLPGIDDLRLAALALDRTPLPPGVRRVRARRFAPPRWEVLEHRALLPLDVRRLGADVVHSPAFDPLRRSPVPWVHTIHDVIPLEYDAPGLDRSGWERYAARMRGADAVITVSQWSAERAQARLGLDPARVRVIHHGIDPRFLAVERREPSGPPYLLHIGAWAPYKGHAEAIEVLDRLVEAGHPHRLRLVGPHNRATEAEVRSLVGRSRHPERIDVTGFVDDVADEFASASALLMTSRMEGFGLPALEAMASGTPVVAFDNSAVGEVVGDGGILVPDGDLDAMVEATAALLSSSSATAALSEQGRARANRFSWEDSARQHAEVYRSLGRQ